jgi:hypothetical protein
MSCTQMGHILVLYIFNLQRGSMECMMSTKGRTGALLLDGNQSVRLPAACKVSLENYLYVFQIAVQKSLYQYVR